MKRVFDFVFSILGLVLLLPLFMIISIIILLDSKGTIFFVQTRVGKNNKDFRLFKFRTMKPNSETKGYLTLGNSDNRITSFGKYLRKYKLDEIPQLINILKGEMSFVGPRPEVRKFVDLFNEEQKIILSVRPGLTDYASLKYFNENEILEKFENPEKAYIEKILPEKLELNLKYIRERSLYKDLQIIIKTIGRIFR